MRSSYVCMSVVRAQRIPDLSLEWRKNKRDAIRRENDDIESDNVDEEKDDVKNRAYKRDNITPPPSRQDNHSTRPNIVACHTLQQIIGHIKYFPVHTSHYSRNSTKKKCLNADLSINKMYYLYQEKHKPDAFMSMKNKGSIEPYVTYEFYFRVFNTNRNYYFGYPRSDTCEVCGVLKLKLGNENDELEKKLHLCKAQHFYDKLKQIKELAQRDPSTEGVCFDSEQNLPVPVPTTGEVFHLRQVWVYNMGFCSRKTGCSKMYTYDETTGKKGSNETVSLLKHYIEKYIPEHVKTLHLFSNNCAGQYKNI
ncbi:hypothetical protein PR048_016528 [Dryococelus australis]|uniref:Uncharacterized protein n=1 Tax=Dryococelus australis TaxID=614101 RepID=A0ABQ9HJY3_9NEOP|nr:hypothetical protein PR048_016528 [Dryococelus australis]